MNGTCSLCGRSVRARMFWFRQPIKSRRHKFDVVFKVEAALPQDAWLCLKCSGDVITAAAAALHVYVGRLEPGKITVLTGGQHGK